MSAKTARLVEFATAELRCATRLPFRFGAVTLDGAPLLHLRLVVDLDGRTGVGMASDLLVPRWFRKDVDRDAAGDQRALRRSLATAAAHYRERGRGTVFELWQQVQQQLVEKEPPSTPDLLERGFGIALIERALIDAVCRDADVAFADALATGLLGRHLARPAPPRRTIAVRHTVGRLDPLRAADVAASERLADGRPQALDEVLTDYGVRWLKVKIGGHHDDDVERLIAIGRLLAELGLDEVGVTLDGNEQFDDLAALQAVWLRTGEDPHGRALLQRVRWVEQPLPRASSIGGGRPQWPHCPLVLDEADCQRRTFRASGYDGVSVKNCKGPFRALLNAGWTAGQSGRFQTSEDLCNLPVLALQQDLATAATLGLEHSERNGHHYFALDHLPTPVVEALLEAHPDLYEHRDGRLALRIRGGQLATGSLQTPGYGCDRRVAKVLESALDWQAME